MTRARPLFVLLARDRPRAVIVRRAPGGWAHLVSWDTARERFEHGAWLRGRIYEDKCDLSPDGELLLTFVMQGRRSESSTTHAWSAISRPPWLHALALWPQGTTYGGGGRFTANRSVILRSSTALAHPDHPATGLEVTTGNPPVHVSSGEVEGADWSGRDQSGRLIFTHGHSLFCRVDDRESLLADFTGRLPDPQPAPEHARRPLVVDRARR